MTSIFSRLFTDGGPSAGAGDKGTVTVPVGKVWVVKDLESYCNAVGGGLAFWHIRSTYLHKQAPSGDATFSFPQLSTVLVAGDSLSFFVSSGTWYWNASGYELSA